MCCAVLCAAPPAWGDTACHEISCLNTVSHTYCAMVAMPCHARPCHAMPGQMNIVCVHPCQLVPHTHCSSSPINNNPDCMIMMSTNLPVLTPSCCLSRPHRHPRKLTPSSISTFTFPPSSFCWMPRGKLSLFPFLSCSWQACHVPQVPFSTHCRYI
jgi:hypothetical protein